MPSRRDNVYSTNEQAVERRKAILELVLAIIGLGVLIEWVSAAIFVTFDSLSVPLVWSWVAFGIVIVGSLVVITYFWQRNNHMESSVALIDVMITYDISVDDGIVVAAPEAPAYTVLEFAAELFRNAYTKNERQALAGEYRRWRVDHRSGQFHQFYYKCHHELLDALLLKTLDFYCERSLGPGSYGKWSRANLRTKRIGVKDLPDRLKTNPYIAPQQRLAIPLPASVSISWSQTDAGWRWIIGDGRHGTVTVDFFKELSIYRWKAEKRTRRIMVLHEGLPEPGEQNEFMALGARMTVRAELNGLLQLLSARRQEVDAYHEWLTRLVFHFEEALDWTYFMEERRPAQQLVDMQLDIQEIRRQLSARR